MEIKVVRLYIIVRSKASVLNHHNHLGAENSSFVPQFLGAEKLRRQCE